MIWPASWVVVRPSEGARPHRFFKLCRKAHVNSDPLLDFIKETVAAAPDLPPPGSEEASVPKPKRQR